MTVNNGSGAGNYTTGRQFRVSANTPPGGQQFALWTGDYQILAQSSQLDPDGNRAVRRRDNHGYLQGSNYYFRGQDPGPIRVRDTPTA